MESQGCPYFNWGADNLATTGDTTMIVQLSLDELDLLVDALERLHDQAVDTKRDLPASMVADHVAHSDAIADLSAKLSRLV